MGAILTVAARKHAIEALKSLLDTALEDKDRVLVTYAWRADKRDRNQVFTMRPRGDLEPSALRAGKLHRNEDSSFSIVIHVHRVGASQDDADDQALAYGEVIETYFAENKCPPELAALGLNWWLVQSYEMDGGPTDRASVSTLIYTISYRARLT